MSEQPLVSIIIPTFNRASLISETLDSVLAQTYSNWECIVVDDGSTDDTDKVIETYVKKDNRFKYYHRPEEHLPGGNGARNFGFKMSKGEYVNWFDSDDIMDINFLKIKIGLITDNFICLTSTIKFNNKKEEKIQNYKIDNLLKSYFFNEIFIGTNDILFLKEFLDNENIIFDEEIHRGQETDFFLKVFLKLKDSKIIFRDYFLTKYRMHNNQKTSNENKEKEIYLKSQMKVLLNFYNNLKIYNKVDKEIIFEIIKRMFGLIYHLNKNKKYYELKEILSICKEFIPLLNYHIIKIIFSIEKQIGIYSYKVHKIKIFLIKK